jgi:hypothetical protein
MLAEKRRSELPAYMRPIHDFYDNTQATEIMSHMMEGTLYQYDDDNGGNIINTTIKTELLKF